MSRDTCLHVVLVLFSLYWFPAQYLLPLQHRKGPGRCSVSLQRPLAGTGRRCETMICKARCTGSTRKAALMPTITDEIWNHPLEREQREKGKHKNMKHFGQTYKRISVWWLLIAQSTMTWKQLNERCVFTFQQSNTEDANPALFVLAWKSWGYLIFTNKKSFQSSPLNKVNQLHIHRCLIFPVSSCILYWDKAEFNVHRANLALTHLPEHHQNLIWTYHITNRMVSSGEQESAPSFTSALHPLHSPCFHSLTIHNYFLMPGNSSHQPVLPYMFSFTFLNCNPQLWGGPCPGGWRPLSLPCFLKSILIYAF